MAMYNYQFKYYHLMFTRDFFNTLQILQFDFYGIKKRKRYQINKLNVFVNQFLVHIQTYAAKKLIQGMKL